MDDSRVLAAPRLTSSVSRAARATYEGKVTSEARLFFVLAPDDG